LTGLLQKRAPAEDDCELRGRGLNPAIEEINAPAVGGDTVLGSRLYTRAAWEEAIRLASTGAVAVGPLVSRRIPLEELQQGMEEVLAGGPVMKVLVDLG
jgi:threonine dehydrogenase-like Zn-dependent dehydrogenase